MDLTYRAYMATNGIQWVTRSIHQYHTNLRTSASSNLLLLGDISLAGISSISSCSVWPLHNSKLLSLEKGPDHLSFHRIGNAIASNYTHAGICPYLCAIFYYKKLTCASNQNPLPAPYVCGCFSAKISLLDLMSSVSKMLQ